MTSSNQNHPRQDSEQCKTQTRNDIGTLPSETLPNYILRLANLHVYPREPRGEKLEYRSTNVVGTLVLERIMSLRGDTCGAGDDEANLGKASLSFKLNRLEVNLQA